MPDIPVELTEEAKSEIRAAVEHFQDMQAGFRRAIAMIGQSERILHKTCRRYCKEYASIGVGGIRLKDGTMIDLGFPDDVKAEEEKQW